MRKSIPALRQAGNESISDLPKIQEIYRRKSISRDTTGNEDMWQRRTASKEFRC